MLVVVSALTTNFYMFQGGEFKLYFLSKNLGVMLHLYEYISAYRFANVSLTGIEDLHFCF